MSDVGITPRLAGTWAGPFGIVEIDSPHVYQVQNIVTGCLQTVHVAHLGLYPGSQPHITANLKDAHQQAWAKIHCCASIVNFTEAEDGTLIDLVE